MAQHTSMSNGYEAISMWLKLCPAERSVMANVWPMSIMANLGSSWLASWLMANGLNQCNISLCPSANAMAKWLMAKLYVAYSMKISIQ